MSSNSYLVELVRWSLMSLRLAASCSFSDRGDDGLRGEAMRSMGWTRGGTDQMMLSGEPEKTRLRSVDCSGLDVATMVRTSQDRDATRVFYTQISSLYDVLADRSERRARALGLSLLNARAGEH